MFKNALMALALVFTASPALAGAPPIKAAKVAKVAKKDAKAAKVNLNTANADELATLPGVGPKKAAAIIAYRGKTPFKTVADATGVKGIGKKTVEKWKDLAFVGENGAGMAGQKVPGKIIKAKNKPKPALKK